MSRIAAFAAGMVCGAAVASPAEPIPWRPPAGAEKAYDDRGALVCWKLGFPTNLLRVYAPPEADEPVPALSPVKVDRHFRPRNAATLEQWKHLRADIRRRVLAYFGKMPPVDVPLAPKLLKQQEHDEYTLRLLTIAFDAKRRGHLCLLIPKAVPTPAAAILMYDGATQGIDRICGSRYTRCMGKHWVREGFVVVALEHWDKVFGESAELATIGAAVHFTRRVVDYLLTQKQLVHSQRIGILGHVYGAEVASFAAAMDDRLAALSARHSWLGPTRPYDTAFWDAPFWADGTAVGAHVYGADRAQPALYQSKRKIPEKPLPFLTQELLALLPPRPYLCVNHMMGAGRGQKTDPAVMHCLAPVYRLYGRPKAMEMVEHRWATHHPVHARHYQVDFFLRAMCGIDPGRAPEATAREILADLGSPQRARQLLAARRAGWWRLAQAKQPLSRLIGGDDLLLRRVAAKALQRLGDMDELMKHYRHPDPMVRLAVVEAAQLHGSEEVFDRIAKEVYDPDRWVWEAKNHALLISPKHQEQ